MSSIKSTTGSLKRFCRYQWLKFLRLQEDPRKVAGGMALGVFVGMTPTVPLHTILALSLASLLRVSPVTAFVGIQICNPLTLGPFYLAAYKMGEFLLYRGRPLLIPQDGGLKDWLHLMWQGGLALQLGGLVIAIPPAIGSYFLALWAIQRYRQHKVKKVLGVLRLSQNPPTTSRPEA